MSKILPSFAIEDEEIKAQKINKEIILLAGIDEAGRGPLAGPVAVGLVEAWLGLGD